MSSAIALVVFVAQLKIQFDLADVWLGSFYRILACHSSRFSVSGQRTEEDFREKSGVGL
jgi:hypothetical protein